MKSKHQNFSLDLFEEPESKADVNKMAYVGSKPASSAARDSDSWFTPKLYTNLASAVLCGVELDPFSSETANKSVGAERYFSVKDDAFKIDWQLSGEPIRSLWMNPPYGRGLINKSISRFSHYWDNESIDSAIVLVNNATETTWFHQLLNRCSSICLPGKRIAFENFDGKSNKNGNTRGQVFFYFGRDTARFKKKFCEIGRIMTHDI